MRSKWTILALVLLAVGLAGPALTGPPPELIYFLFEPRVVDFDNRSPVVLTVVVENGPSAVEIQWDSGKGNTSLRRTADPDIWEVTLDPDDLLTGYAVGDYHNKVGILVLFDSSSNPVVPSVQVIVNVLDSTIPAVSVLAYGSDKQASSHVLNIRRDQPWAGPFPAGGYPIDAIQEFYNTFDDDVDFLALVNNVRRQGNRYYTEVSNQVDGIGQALFDSNGVYGSAGNLRGLINIPFDTIFDLAATGNLHEIGHRWCCSDLGDDIPVLAPGVHHWPISEIAYGIMGASGFGGQGILFSWEFIDQGNGDFLVQAVTPALEYNDIELYLMGLLPVADVAAQAVFTDPNTVPLIYHGNILEDPNVHWVSAQTMENDLGVRQPAYGSSQTVYRIGTIVLSMGRLLTPEEMAFFDHMALRGEAITELPFNNGPYSATTKPLYLATGQRAWLETSVCYTSSDVCDGLDNDCDGQVDEGVQQITYFFDGDGDGFGVDDPTVISCHLVPGFAVLNGDCDDGSAMTFPGADEINDGIDNQCNGDAGFGVIDELTGAGGFLDPDNPDRLSWPLQKDATSYEIVRSSSPDFLGTCWSVIISEPEVIDLPAPPAGKADYYMARSLTPNAGSFGVDGNGNERVDICQGK